MRWLLVLLVVVLLALHQDFWNWDNRSLVFGFLPVGLAYHMAYSIAAACLMALLVRFAWPVPETPITRESGPGAETAPEPETRA